MIVGRALAFGACCVLAFAGCDQGSGTTSTSASGGANAAQKKPQVAVIAKSTVNAYWKAVESGAKKAGDELGAEILWTGPDAETNHTQQANMVDNMVNKGVAGIVIAPTNLDALVRPVESAVAKGVPVILIDSSLNSDKPLSSISTDNYAAGAQAAEALIKAIGTNRKHDGSVIMLRFLENSGSTESREKGFSERIGKEPGLKLVEAAYTKGQGSTTDAADTADALLRRFTRDGELQVDGIFASNQPTAIGMLTKIDQTKAAGTKIDCPFVGFDAHEVLLAGIRDGRVAAIVTQDPKMMGYLGVKTMIDYLNKKPIEKNVATNTATVTKENIDTPQIKAVTLEE